MSAAASSSAGGGDSGKTEMDRDVYDYLRTLDGNLECVDCGDANPDWGSPTLGVLFCMGCSGYHRCVLLVGS